MSTNKDLVGYSALVGLARWCRKNFIQIFTNHNNDDRECIVTPLLFTDEQQLQLEIKGCLEDDTMVNLLLTIKFDGSAYSISGFNFADTTWCSDIEIGYDVENNHLLFVVHSGGSNINLTYSLIDLINNENVKLQIENIPQSYANIMTLSGDDIQSNQTNSEQYTFSVSNGAVSQFSYPLGTVTKVLNAEQLANNRTISLSGDVTGAATTNFSNNVSIDTTISNAAKQAIVSTVLQDAQLTTKIGTSVNNTLAAITDQEVGEGNISVRQNDVTKALYVNSYDISNTVNANYVTKVDTLPRNAQIGQTHLYVGNDVLYHKNNFYQCIINEVTNIALSGTILPEMEIVHEEHLQTWHDSYWNLAVNDTISLQINLSLNQAVDVVHNIIMSAEEFYSIFSKNLNYYTNGSIFQLTRTHNVKWIKLYEPMDLDIRNVPNTSDPIVLRYLDASQTIIAFLADYTLGTHYIYFDSTGLDTGCSEKDYLILNESLDAITLHIDPSHVSGYQLSAFYWQDQLVEPATDIVINLPAETGAYHLTLMYLTNNTVIGSGHMVYNLIQDGEDAPEPEPDNPI